MKKRTLLQAALLLATASTFSTAQAQATTPIKFQLDWRFEGPSALFLQPVAKGYFKAAGLDVAVDAGNGSGGAGADSKTGNDGPRGTGGANELIATHHRQAAGRSTAHGSVADYVQRG